MSLPLSQLYSRVLTAASDAYDLPTIEDTTQELIQACLADLTKIQQRVSDFALFSSNETLEDISTHDLLYLSVPYVCAEVQGRVRTTEREERLPSLVLAQSLYQSYISSLETYGIITEADTKLFGQLPASAASRRELKIKQYQHEKDLRTRIDVIRKRRHQQVETGKTDDFTLIRSLLPSPDHEEDDEDDEVLRETTLLLLRLFHALSQAQLKSISDELELLRTAPPPLPYSPRPADDDWKLDSSARQNQGPILSPTGKPLRPFTILPSGTADRARLQSQVFGPGHILPSMTIEEYLEVERQRGNILTGGGPASEAAPTSSEQLALDAEMDGTLQSEEKAEQKRLKDEKWANTPMTIPRGQETL
ncbi:TAP42-like protein [Mucidula mucida]|nr:TAP42-like protein [Mucidula mucida]